jgi:branched-chain amino acid transport system permease protein
VLRLAAIVFFAGGLLFCLIGWLRGDTFFLRLATEALIYGGLALSVDILLGYGGMLSLGQALYFGLGAYVSAVLMLEYRAGFWLAVAASIVTGAVAGLVGGLIAIRARGVYFALITFGLAQVVAKIIYNTRDFRGMRLGASDGIIGIPVPTIPLGIFTTRADSPAAFFLIVLAAIGMLYLALSYYVRTPYGRVLSGVRINESRLAFLGYRTSRFKIGAFVIAATIASFCGGLYPMLRSFVSPELLAFEVSTNAIVAVIIGGTGTLIGPLYGAVLLAFGKSIIGTITHHHLMVIGALFMAVVIFFPRGLIGYLMQRRQASLASRKEERP